MDKGGKLMNADDILEQRRKRKLEQTRLQEQDDKNTPNSVNTNAIEQTLLRSKPQDISATAIIEITKNKAEQRKIQKETTTVHVDSIEEPTEQVKRVKKKKINEKKQQKSVTLETLPKQIKPEPPMQQNQQVPKQSIENLPKLSAKKSSYAQRYEEIYHKRNKNAQEISYIDKFKTDYINVNFGKTARSEQNKIDQSDDSVHGSRYYSEEEFTGNFSLNQESVQRPQTLSHEQFSQSREKKIDAFFSNEISTPQKIDDIPDTQVEAPEKLIQPIKDEQDSLEKYKNNKTQQDLIEEPIQDKEEDRYMNIKQDTFSLKIKLMVRFGFLTVLFATALYLALALNFINLPLPTFLIPEKNIQMFLIVNTGLFVLSALICCNTIGTGFIALFKGANNDTPIAIATLACIIQAVVLIFAPENATIPSVNLLFPVVLLGLLFNTYGKLILVSRINQNMDLLIELERKKIFCLNTLQDEEIIKHMTHKFTSAKGSVSLCKETQKVTNYVDSAFSEDYNEVLSQKVVWVSIFCAVAVAGGCYFFTQNPYIAITAFATLMVLCAPFTATTISNFPIKRANKKLSIDKTLVCGYDAVDEYGDTELVMINIRDIFTPASIIMHGMKVFDQSMIDCAILDGASVMHECQNHLEGVFLKLVDGDKTLLNTVDSIVYEDGLGISAWVNGKRVLIGNRQLMRLHEIKMPEASYEEKFTKDGKDVLYISNSGSLTAMFVLSYQKVNGIARQLKDLAKQKVSLLLYSTDPNINAEKIAKIYAYPAGLVHMIAGRYADEFIGSTSATPFTKGGMIMHENTNVFKAIASVIKLKRSIVKATIVQYLFVILGFAVVGYLSFVSLLNYADFWQIILYQLVSFGIVTLFTLKKYD